MNATIEAFHARLGLSSTPGEKPLHFPVATPQAMWLTMARELGVGAFMNGFVYLFGARARELDPLLEDWSFLFKQDKERWVVGSNAYGALLVLEEPTKDTLWGSVGLVDPLEVRYITDPNLVYTNLIGRWLPQDLLPHFLDNTVYQQWKRTAGEALAFDQLLAIQLPLGVGGQFELPNFRVENIYDYYRQTSEIYRKYGNDD